MEKPWDSRIIVGYRLIIAIYILNIPATAVADQLSIPVSSGQYRIVDDGAHQRIEIEGGGQLAEPGKPSLPAGNFLIALPPGAKVRAVDVVDHGGSVLPGTYNIAPAPPILPLVDQDLYKEYIENINIKWRQAYNSTYSSDRSYPGNRVQLIGSGSLRKYAYASVLYYPFDYSPKTGKLEYYGQAEIIVNYDLPIPGSIEAQKADELRRDDVADDRAAKLFVNYDQIKPYYHVEGPPLENPLNIYDYVIITHQNLVSSINASDFINWKSSLGYNVRIVTTADPEIIVQPGEDLAAKIRNFLIGYYSVWGIEYVLLVGNYNTIPMRYCYPDYSNHANGAGDPSNWPWAGEVPTDYYYADLSSTDDQSWDSDGDGFCGEFGQDNPDMLAEVYVGRIPTSIGSRITYALNKLVTFEQDTGPWKDNVLHAGAIAFYENDDYSGRELIDGAALLDQMEYDLMPGMAVSHYSEQEGLAPSAFQWPGLSEASFIGDWRNGQYGIVNWYAHGWSSYVARKIWSWDDGDGVPESHEMSWPTMIGINSNLDDDYPSIVFALSCMVSYPEPNSWGNLGIDLLTKPSFGASAGIVSGTRVVWVSTGGGELHSYEFSHNLINFPYEPKKVGEALYDSKFYISQNYNWNHYAGFWDTFTFNLYGDPSLERNGAVISGIADQQSRVPNEFSMTQNYPNPFNANTTIRYNMEDAGRVRIDIYDLLGRKIETLVEEEKQAGQHQVVWDASGHSSGVYFYRIEAGYFSETRKMILLK